MSPPIDIAPDPRDATIGRLSAELAEAKSQLYVPGRWRCPKCKFGLMQMKLRASDGAVGVRDDPGEKCPNCDTPLWRVTEREAGDELAERCQEYLQRAVKAEADLAEALEALKYGEAWTGEYLEDCRNDGLAAEVERVEFGLGKIRAVLAKLSATKGV